MGTTKRTYQIVARAPFAFDGGKSAGIESVVRSGVHVNRLGTRPAVFGSGITRMGSEGRILIVVAVFTGHRRQRPVGTSFLHRCNNNLSCPSSSIIKARIIPLCIESAICRKMSLGILFYIHIWHTYFTFLFSIANKIWCPVK